MKPCRIALFAMAAISTTGCSVKTLEADERVVTFSTMYEVVNSEPHEYKVTCPEASPDALAMLAGSLSGETKGVNLAAAYSESGANIGLRTHSIQLLRDQLYSICQGYANRGLSAFTYQTLLARNQRNTVVLMAIEQLTGILKTPSVAVSTSSQADAASNMARLTDELSSQQAKLKAISDKTSTEYTDTKKNIETLTEGLKTARGSVAKASGTAETNTEEQKSFERFSDASIVEITSAVENLAGLVVDGGEADNLHVCTEILRTNASSSSITSTNQLVASCQNMIRAMVDGYAAKQELKNKLLAKNSGGQSFTTLQRSLKDGTFEEAIKTISESDPSVPVTK